MWLRNTGQTEHSAWTGPDFDHTTLTDEGWYLYVPPAAQSYGEAVLQSEVLSAAAVSCFRFWYHIILEDYNSNQTVKLGLYYQELLQFETQGKIVFLANITSFRGNEWHSFNYTITNVESGRIILKTYRSDNRAAVAIDDLSLEVGSACNSDSQTSTTHTSTPHSTTPEPIDQKVWDCDFESACNSWYTTNAWKLQSGSGGTYKLLSN